MLSRSADGMTRVRTLGFALVAASCSTFTPEARTVATAPARLSEPERLLSLAFPEDGEVVSSCGNAADEPSLARCVVDVRFGSDGRAHELLGRLYREHGILPGIEARRVIDDGDYRGRVDLEPASSFDANRQHVEWLLDAFVTLDTTLGELGRHAAAPIRFARKPAVVRFFETTSTTTPSAFVVESAIGFNLRGELWSSPESVFETLVHELFHLSDAEHGNWSEKALRAQHDAIRARCEGDLACFDRYAPHETKVDGGFYYAFHPTSDVREYAAELAIRFVREQRAWLLRPEAPPDAPPFKCLAPENEAGWTELGREFFAGIDLTPPC